jgi:Na+/H+ antiporter NhaD/arsenite permease-like protein
MSRAQLVLCTVLLGALVLQAARPQFRLLIVTFAAGLSCLLSTLLATGTTSQLLSEVPWDVLIILVGLGLLSELLVTSRLFGLLALWSTEASRANPRRLLVYFAIGMYLVSGLVNNLTALLLVLPVLLILLKLMGVGQRFVSWLLGTLLIACNLGGAATPIGDFPAILLLGRGKMTFGSYLSHALPPTLIALLLLILAVVLLVRPTHGMTPSSLAEQLSVRVMRQLYRNVRLDWHLAIPSLSWLLLMLIAWLLVPLKTGITPDLICWVGVGLALLWRASLGEKLLRTRVDFEAALFLLGLFVMVGAVRRTGLFALLANRLTALPLPPLSQLLLFLVIAGVTTGLFSAGPSMAALLEVAEVLARRFPPHAVYVGLALSVCAGSSFLLTAATSGPLLQTLTERAGLRDRSGNPIRFGFFEFLPIGLLGFAVIESVAIGYALWATY